MHAHPDPIVYVYGIVFFFGSIALIAVGVALIGVFYKGNADEDKKELQ